jgi:methylase of polypeptide subunit release factors
MEAMLEDPVLAELHEAANQRVEARLEEYKKTEAYAELRDSLIEAGKVPITKVEAKPPQARDPAKIAALMSRVEKKAAEKPVSERRNENVDGWANSDGSPYVEGDIDLSSPISVDWVVNHEVVLPADPRVFSPEALNGVLSGRFDRRNARNIEGYFEGCNRLLEIGTGVGFMATRLNRLREDIIVVAQDKRPELIKIARSIASHNNLGSKGRLMFMDVEMVTEANGVRKAIGFNTWLRQFQPDALRIVDTATITPAILVVSDLSSVRRIVIPFENSRELETHRSTYSTAMKMKGFSETADRHESGSLQFDRSHKVILRGVRQVSAEVK